MPEGDSDYSSRWRAIKSRFTHHLNKAGVPLKRGLRGEYQHWQRRFWEHTLRNDSDFNRHVDYIHWNPVKHGLTDQANKWPYSSFHRYLRLGLLPDYWSNNLDEVQSDYGE